MLALPWILALLAAASPPDAPTEDAVPFTAVRGKLLVPVAIGGYGPYSFIVDASAERPVVDGTLGLAGNALPSLQVGSLALDRLAADTADLSGLQRTLGVAVTGLLPARLGDGLLAVDFGRNTLSYAPQSERSYTYSAPLLPGGDGPEVLLACGDRMQRARLDLAYAGDLALPETLAREWGLLDPGVPHLEFESVPGAASRLQVRLSAIRLGGATLRRPLATVRSEIDLPVLGTGFLRHFAVLFDFASERLSLEPAGSAAPETPAVAGYGLVLHAFEGNDWSLLVAVNSPAYRAGIRSGDLLDTIDGETAAGKPYEVLTARLDAQPGHNVKLVIRHAEQTKQLALTAEPLI